MIARVADQGGDDPVPDPTLEENLFGSGSGLLDTPDPSFSENLDPDQSKHPDPQLCTELSEGTHIKG